MTVLQRTDLTTSQKIQCAAAAVAGQHAYGSKTALSETYEILRIPVKVISDSGLNVISDSGQSGHRSERSDAGVGL